MRKDQPVNLAYTLPVIIRLLSSQEAVIKAGGADHFLRMMDSTQSLLGFLRWGRTRIVKKIFFLAFQPCCLEMLCWITNWEKIQQTPTNYSGVASDLLFPGQAQTEAAKPTVGCFK